MTCLPGCRSRRRAATCSAGFTLIELLVVIAILSLLVSLLLPALGSVRQVARQVVCSSNLRQMAMGVQSYGEENQDWIVGSPEGSGRDAAAGVFNGVAIQTYDFFGPIAYHLGYAGPGEGGTTEQERAARFNWYREGFKPFICPSNDIPSAPFSNPGGGWSTGRMIGYNMSTQFTSSSKAPPLGTGHFTAQDRSTYTPKLSNLGTLPHMKIAVFEGHRWANQTDDPDFDPEIDAAYGGAFGGVGGWKNDSKELNRWMAPGEPGASISGFGDFNDARSWAFRHGRKKDGTPGQTKVYGNLAFFDGHVTLYDDGEATNPDFWFPGNTKLRSANAFWRYARNRWPGKFDTMSASTPYVVP